MRSDFPLNLIRAFAQPLKYSSNVIDTVYMDYDAVAESGR